MSSYRTCCLTARLCTNSSHDLRRFVTSAIRSTANSAQAKENSEEIVIPKRKKRNAVSILEALSSTVGKDPTAAAYMYMDDPYLIPTDNINKKSFALSKAAGRKAARYLAERYGKFVREMYDFAEPKIEAYQVKEPGYKFEEPDEEALLERIEKRRVQHAVEVYKTTVRNGVTLSDSTLESLLQLVCVYNGEDPPPALDREERWYQREFQGQDRQRKTWQEGSIAEDIFANLTEKSAASYSSLMRAYCKYGSHDKAWELYNEIKERRIPVSLSTSNTLIKTAPFSSNNFENKWQRILILLKDLQVTGQSPNLATFNCVLFALSRMTRFNRSINYALQTLSEMKKCEIEPSLASWCHVVRIVYDKDESQASILGDIIEHIKDTEFTLQDPVDLEFFSTAMQKCYNNLQDLDLAYKIDALLNYGDNHKFLADSSKGSTYYSNFFRLLCLMGNMETIMKYYEQMAPNVWTPTYSALEDLLKAVELHEGYEHLPLIWSDILLFHNYRSPDILKQLMSLMAKQKHEPELQSRLAEVARGIKHKWEQDQQRGLRAPMQLTAPMISDLIIVVTRADNFELAWEFMEIMLKESREIAGELSGDALNSLLDICITRKEVNKTMQCVSQMAELGVPELKDTVERIQTELKLSDSQRSVLEDLARNL